MLRPAGWLGRLASPRLRLVPPTGPPVYGRACPSQGLPGPGSAITTRPNHPLPRQDFHLQACQRPKAAPHPDTAPERGQKPSPLPPSHPAKAGWEGVIRFSTLPRAAARPARSGTGLALGYYLAAPPGQKRAALRAGRVELGAVSGCARSRIGARTFFCAAGLWSTRRRTRIAMPRRRRHSG